MTIVAQGVTVKDVAKLEVRSGFFNNGDINGSYENVSQHRLTFSFDVDQSKARNLFGSQIISFVKDESGNVRKQMSYSQFQGSVVGSKSEFIYPSDSFFNEVKSPTGPIQGIFGLPTNAKVGDSGTWFITYQCQPPYSSFTPCMPIADNVNYGLITGEIKWSLLPNNKETAIFRVFLSDGENFDFTVNASNSLSPRSYSLLISGSSINISF
jgi:hypothetical protein